MSYDQLYDLTPRSFSNKHRGYNKNKEIEMRSNWEQTRILVHTSLMPHLKKKMKAKGKKKFFKLGAAQKLGAAALMEEFDFIQKEDIDDLQVNTGATTPVFLNEEERKRSITLQGRSVNLVSRSVTADTSTNITVVGLSTGATFNVAVTIKADQSTL